MFFFRKMIYLYVVVWKRQRHDQWDGSAEYKVDQPIINIFFFKHEQHCNIQFECATMKYGSCWVYWWIASNRIDYGFIYCVSAGFLFFPRFSCSDTKNNNTKIEDIRPLVLLNINSIKLSHFGQFGFNRLGTEVWWIWAWRKRWII